MDLLSLKEHLARTLLIHYRWDVDKVIAVLVEKGKDKLYEEAGVTVSEHDDNLSSELSLTVMCIICMEEVSASEVTKMDCGHYFCNNCESCFRHFLLFEITALFEWIFSALDSTQQKLNYSFLGVGQNNIR